MALNKEHEFGEKLRQIAFYHKVLSHPARLAILEILGKYESAICNEIVVELPLSQSTISQHLKELKAADFVLAEQDGPRVIYTLNMNKIKAVSKKWNKWHKKLMSSIEG